MQKAGNFFQSLFPTSTREGNELKPGANRKRKCFAFCYVDETDAVLCRTALAVGGCLTIILIFLRTTFPQLIKLSFTVDAVITLVRLLKDAIEGNT